MDQVRSMDDLPTPALLIDAPQVRDNIQRLQAHLSSHGIGLRPHTKTHKSLRIGRLQLDAGAVGLTVAKAGEAEVMAQLGADLLLAYPGLDRFRTARIAQLAARGVSIHVGLDSQAAADAFASAAQAASTTIGILVDLDVGMHRTGVQSPEAALALAQQIDRKPGLRLDGIMIYPGHVWGAPGNQQEPMGQIAAIVQQTIDLWKRSGLAARIISGGSTPSAYQSQFIPQLTEVRPGTYVYNDMNTVRGGFATLGQCAARMLVTVVSEAVPGQVVVDAGSKTLTTDRCIPAPDSGFGHVVEYPEARITALSEEHGQIDIRNCARKPRIGDRLTIVPNHICACVNLHDAAWWIEPGALPERLTTDARGMIS